MLSISEQTSSNGIGNNMAARIGNFIIFIILTIFTLGLYPLYFMVTRQQEQVELLRDIKDALEK